MDPKINKGLSQIKMSDINKWSDLQSLTMYFTPRKSNNFTPSEASNHRSDSSCLPKREVSGLKKGAATCLGQEDFLARYETFHSHLPNGKSSGKSKLRI